ncbi:MAG TPA: hypothetical protein DIS85_06515 [Vagococcus sp.]|nr:hypothetical protein [Vagococcus sp.]
MEFIKLIILNRWYLPILSLVYCILIYKICKDNRYLNILKYYSIIVQILFLIFYFFMAFQLASMKYSNYDLFAYGLTLYYILGCIPFILIINQKLKKNTISLLIRIGINIFIICIGIILYYPFIILTYGFGP